MGALLFELPENQIGRTGNSLLKLSENIRRRQRTTPCDRVMLDSLEILALAAALPSTTAHTG